jgi:hypothetical protein
VSDLAEYFESSLIMREIINLYNFIMAVKCGIRWVLFTLNREYERRNFQCINCDTNVKIKGKLNQKVNNYDNA